MTSLTIFSPSGDATPHECRRLPQNCPVCGPYLPAVEVEGGAG